MNLETLIALIDRDLDEGLPLTESRHLREFLAAHDDWRRYYESLKQLEGAARATPLIHPSPGFADRVMERIALEDALALGGAGREAEGASPRQLRWERWGVWVAAAAVAALALLVTPIAGYMSSGSFTDAFDKAVYGIESVGGAVTGVMDASPSVVESVSLSQAVWGVGLALAVLAAVVVIDVLVARRERRSALRARN